VIQHTHTVSAVYMVPYSASFELPFLLSCKARALHRSAARYSDAGFHHRAAPFVTVEPCIARAHSGTTEFKETGSSSS
jgi:hypothetical protein